MFKHNILNNLIIKRCCSNQNLSIANVLKQKREGDHIKVKGWVQSIRKMKDNLFLDITDGSCSSKLQVVLRSTEKPPKLTSGSSVTATGALSLTPRGELELNSDNFELLGTCEVQQGYPFAPKKTYPAEYLRQYLHFRPRTKTFTSLLRVRNAATMAIHKHLDEQGYINVHTPILTSNDCEGAGEVFTVQPDNKNILKSMGKVNVNEEDAYFGSKVFLTVSGQLQLEAVAHGLSKVYTFGPTFRAENSRSRLHLSEFYMLEVETAFQDEIEQLISTIESLVKSVTETILDKYTEDIENINENHIESNWLGKKFCVITYEEAIKLLGESKRSGFTKDEEMLLVKHCGNVPTFVINWPKQDKPFYMRQTKDDPTKVAALDLLGPSVGEIAGGSLRENDYDKLSSQLPHDNLEWYLDLRKFGGVPTAGFGLGFERYLQLITGINNIKDTIPFPRWPHNCQL